MNRRSFLKQVGAAVAGAGIGAPAYLKNFLTSPPSEKVVMGLIGNGGMGGAHLGWFAGCDDVEIAALCDVDRNHLERAQARVKAVRPGRAVETFPDFRLLLERKDIDAVSIATPDHWHALIAIHAFKAGKDVYGEKPLSYTIEEGRAMLNAQRKGDRVFQLGTQIHAGENYHRVVELVRSGALGKIHTVRVWKTGGAPMIEYRPDEPPPAHLDWNMWLGPRRNRSYNPHRCHFNFRYFWDYSAGQYADFWCHIADIAFWALDLGSPETVEARGKLNTKGMAETHEWIDVDFEFRNVKFHWTTRIPEVPGAEGKDIGACFEGTKGHLVTDYGSRRIFINGEEVEGGDLKDVPKTLQRSPGHQRNFIDCVKSRELTHSNLAYAHNMTVPMHLGLIAYWTGRTLQWDGGKENFKQDKAAQVYLGKDYREPWSL